MSSASLTQSFRSLFRSDLCSERVEISPAGAKDGANAAPSRVRRGKKEAALVRSKTTTTPQQQPKQEQQQQLLQQLDTTALDTMDADVELQNASNDSAMKDKGFLKRLAENAEHRAKDVGDRALLLKDMLEMHVKGVKELARWEVAIIVSCFVYIFNPIDVMLDALPGGFLDDVVVLGAAAAKLDNSVKNFKKWKDEYPHEYEKGKKLPWFGKAESGAAAENVTCDNGHKQEQNLDSADKDKQKNEEDEIVDGVEKVKQHEEQNEIVEDVDQDKQKNEQDEIADDVEEDNQHEGQQENHEAVNKDQHARSDA